MLRHGIRGGRRRLAWAYYVEGVSSDLQRWLLVEETQLKKQVDMLMQENKKIMEDLVLLKHQWVT